ncbi:hypothetical protein [Enterococcus italicus]|uniref:hypothetical protein n=1 Tax=Enterococcus italicus TaxID=246144 RepID=UPI0028ABD9F0|nr:hypothetical protein [Enterococcus italicus]
MDTEFVVGSFDSTIHYGQTFFQAFTPTQFKGKHLIFFANQQYYESFANQATTFFEHTDMDWYILSNQRNCHTVNEMLEGLKFLAKFNRSESYMFVSFGNKGAIQLTSFFHQFSPLSSEFLAICLSLQSFSVALTKERFLIQPPFLKSLIWENLPQASYVFLPKDTVSLGERLSDFLVLLRIALTDDAFYTQLQERYPNKERLVKESYMNYIEFVTQSYATNTYPLTQYGSWFEEILYETENSLVLSAEMKHYLGFLFHFIWNCVTIEKSELCRDVLRWMRTLGFPINVPDPFVVSDFLVKAAEESKNTPRLVQVDFFTKNYQLIAPNEKQFIDVYQLYQHVIEEEPPSDRK